MKLYRENKTIRVHINIAQDNDESSKPSGLLQHLGGIHSGWRAGKLQLKLRCQTLYSDQTLSPCSTISAFPPIMVSSHDAKADHLSFSPLTSSVHVWHDCLTTSLTVPLP